MLGLELQESRVVAVSVDDRGHVLARALVEVSGTLAAAAAAALTAVSASDRAPLGLASANLESAAIAEVAEGLARRFTALPPPGPIASGTAAAVAEAWVGAARGAEEVVYFAAGDHTSGGIVRHGIPVTGAHGRAGSIAWLALNPVEREDYRKVGCLEAEVAAGGIVRRLIWRIKAGDRSRVQETVGNDLSAITIDHVLQAARHGDGVSISVVRDTAKYLGMAAANMVAVTDPDTLVLGGIMASDADLLLEPVRVEISRRLPHAMMDAVTIVPATLGTDAAAMGAARLAATDR